MSRNLAWTEVAWSDYVHWQGQDKKTLIAGIESGVGQSQERWYPYRRSLQRRLRKMMKRHVTPLVHSPSGIWVIVLLVVVIVMLT